LNSTIQEISGGTKSGRSETSGGRRSQRIKGGKNPK